MKKRLLVFALCFGLGVTGCSNRAPEESMEIDEDGNYIHVSNLSTVYSPAELPYSVPYNETEIVFNSIDVYQDKYNSEYRVNVLITLDTSNLTEDEYHWLCEEDIEYESCSIKSEENNFDEDLSYRGRITGDDSLILVFYNRNGYRNSVEGYDISAQIWIQQQEMATYENSDGEIAKGNRSHDILLTFEDIKPQSTNDIPENIYNAMLELFSVS